VVLIRRSPTALVAVQLFCEFSNHGVIFPSVKSDVIARRVQWIEHGLKEFNDRQTPAG
jgi:hypothetical protein